MLSYILCHIIMHTMSHHHTYYVTSSYILCHIIIHTMSHQPPNALSFFLVADFFVFFFSPFLFCVFFLFPLFLSVFRGSRCHSMLLLLYFFCLFFLSLSFSFYSVFRGSRCASDAAHGRASIALTFCRSSMGCLEGNQVQFR